MFIPLGPPVASSYGCLPSAPHCGVPETQQKQREQSMIWVAGVFNDLMGFQGLSRSPDEVQQVLPHAGVSAGLHVIAVDLLCG